jgi:secondary thiamine-phosphate synthase enzyme
MLKQFEINLHPFQRGLHIITHLIENKLPQLPEVGMINVFIKHTSAALTLNENADPSARADLESFLDHIAPENHPLYTHTTEGNDDMPAHIKSSFIGNSLTIPVTNGRLNLGTWQGIYLCEFRNYGGSRRLVLTVYS